MPWTSIPLREICGVRSGDKGDISDLTLFADDDETYELLLREVTVERVRDHFGALVNGRDRAVRGARTCWP